MIYEKLHREWQERVDAGTATITIEPEEGSEEAEEGEAREPIIEEIPEPPHLLPAMTNDAHRQERWQDTVEWAEKYGFVIPPMSEDEKYYKM